MRACLPCEAVGLVSPLLDRAEDSQWPETLGMGLKDVQVKWHVLWNL